VVWNIFYFSIYWECHHPNWRTPSFFRGVGIPPSSKIMDSLSTKRDFRSGGVSTLELQLSFGQVGVRFPVPNPTGLMAVENHRSSRVGFSSHGADYHRITCLRALLSKLSMARFWPDCGGLTLNRRPKYPRGVQSLAS
jgi:hypothetical protein